MVSLLPVFWNNMIIIASHISDLSGPTEALLNFLLNKNIECCAILNPLEYCATARRKVIWNANGFTKSKVLYTNRNRSVVTWLIDSLIVLYFTFLTPKRISLFIGCDPLNASIGALYKMIGKVDKLVYYSVDWSEQRFSNSLINLIYYFLDSLSYKFCDENWCVSQTMIEKRCEKFQSNKCTLVPVGIENYSKKPRKNHNNTIVFLGAFEKSKGIDLLYAVWPKIYHKIPKLKLILIGKTPQGVVKTPYEQLFSRLKNVVIKGVLTQDEVIKALSSCGIGLAPYQPMDNSVTLYADPSRIRAYLASGIPVITTKVPRISSDIEQNHMGLVINYSEKDLEQAINTIMLSKNYVKMSQEAISYSKKFLWDTIFTHALDKYI